MVIPALTALVIGELVAPVTSAADGATAARAALGPIVVLGVLVVVSLSADVAIGPLRNWVAWRVNGHVRAMARRIASAPAQIGHLEDQQVRDVTAMPISMSASFTVGAGVEGAAWMIARYAGALVAALVIARFSIVLAVFTFATLALQRSLLRRHYAHSLSSGMMASMGPARAASYWSDVVCGPPGAKELRLFGFRDWAVEHFGKNARVRSDVLQDVTLSAFPVHVKTAVLTFLAAAVPLVVAGRAAASGDITAQLLASTMFGVTAVFGQLGYMGSETYSIEVAVTQLDALRALEESYDTPPADSAEDRPANMAAGASVPEIVFDDVWFHYPGTDRDVLRGVSFTLEPGSSVALVGENGVGKTTVLKLLTLMYTPTAGRILIDGTDLADLDPREWRRRLAVIFQEFVHFELSARDNVAIADLDGADLDADLLAAADGAGALRTIEALPRGWDTMLSRAFTDGTDLSGGQWQRIALARALFAARRGGQVLVLDEPTASLDATAEVELFDQLLSHASGCTTVLVSHRFSTVRRASRILVLDDGIIAEDGDHRSLTALGGLYARLYSLQATRFTDDTAGREDAGRSL